MSLAYMARSEVELKKLGISGRTVLVAAGDEGTGGTCDKFEPLWPASSPHVTTVGMEKREKEREREREKRKRKREREREEREREREKEKRDTVMEF
jgi:hypothetical protein